jgi:hypothetical protein
MEGMRAHRKTQAKQYFIAHPEASISECVADLHRRGINISERTVAQARSELAQKGVLPQGRNAKESIAADHATAVTIAKDMILDDTTMKALAEGDMTDVVDLDDEEIRKRLLKGVIRIALDPKTHVDTRLSASVIWTKLKDMARVQDLGPGKPMTRVVAIERLSELCAAVGPEIALAAMQKAFNIKESADEGEVPAHEGAAPSSPAGPASTPGSPSDVHPIEARGEDGLGRRDAPDEHQDQG